MLLFRIDSRPAEKLGEIAAAARMRSWPYIIFRLRDRGKDRLESVVW